MPDPLFRKIDCLQIPVPDLEAGLAFYRDQLGHALIWRTATAAGLRMPDSNAEIVIQTERAKLEANITVASADAAAVTIAGAGGRVVVPPFDIQIGRCGDWRRDVECMPAGVEHVWVRLADHFTDRY